MGELSNINIFGRLLDNSEMEAITLCQDYLEGDLVKESFRNNQIHAMLPPDLLGRWDLLGAGQRDERSGRAELRPVVQTNLSLATLAPRSVASFGSHQCKIISDI